MSTQIPVVLVAAVVAGGAGAFATRALTPAPQTETPSGPAALAPDSDLNENVARLLDQQAEIMSRLDKLEVDNAMASAGSVRVPAADGKSEVDLAALIDARLAELSGSASTGALVTPEFRNMVDTVMEMREEEERLAAEQRRAERETQQLENRLTRMQTDLGLDANQVDGMRRVLTDANERRDQLGQEMRAAREAGVQMDREEMRATWSAYTEETNLAVQNVLTPTQYEQYQESNQNTFGRGRGFGGGGDTGAGGGGRRGRGN